MSVFMAGRVLGSAASGSLSDRSVQSENLFQHFKKNPKTMGYLN